MSMNNIVKPSLSQLPIEDIAAELKSDKDNRRFMTKEDNAKDVDNVAGYASNRVAIAVSPDDRQTVANAQKLNGKLASEYLSSEEGKRILGISNIMSNIYSNEIRNSREEFLESKANLVKTGLVEDSNCYEGFYDAFKRGNIKYDGYICGIAKAIVGNSDELFINDTAKLDYFTKGKKFIIKRIDTNQEVTVTSDSVTASGKVKFYPTVNILDSIDAIQILKSNGEYTKSSYSFSSTQKDISNPLKERYCMQSDDTRTAYKIINQSNTGYGAYFKVSNNAAGALTKFSVRAEVEGTPGSLICHVLKKEAVTDPNGNFKISFKNIEEAKTKGYWLATSQPVPASDAQKESDIYFNFFDVTKNNYPKVEGTQYIFIIECLAATETDYWKIRFSYYENGNAEVEDLEKYNNSFAYQKLSDDNDTDKCLTTIDEINKYDILFTLVTRELIDEDEMGKQEGLYSAHIVLPNPININSMRLSTRINREGMFYASTIDETNTIFTLEKENVSSYQPNDSRFKEDDIVIIANQFAKIKRCTSNQIEIKSPIHIDNRILKFYSRRVFNADMKDYETQIRIPIYRMNYRVFIQPSLIDWSKWDAVNGQYETKALSESPVELPLTGVFADGYKTNNRISDKLVFENSFARHNDDLVLANDFELQIYWKSPYTYEEINSFKKNDLKELIGRIYDIILTFDKKY